MTARCQVMLCKEPAYGLVRVGVLVQGVPGVRELPACKACADQVADALTAQRPLGLTPDGALYLADLLNLYRPLR